jgi:hypothetical protein
LPGKYIMALYVHYKILLLLTTNINKENIYCDLRGKIYNFMNKSLHASLLLHPIIILIALFCILKIVLLWDVSPEHYIKTHNRMKMTVDFDSLVRTADHLRAALHVLQHGLSAELAPISDGCRAELMLMDVQD